MPGHHKEVSILDKALIGMETSFGPVFLQWNRMVLLWYVLNMSQKLLLHSWYKVKKIGNNVLGTRAGFNAPKKDNLDSNRKGRMLCI